MPRLFKPLPGLLLTAAIKADPFQVNNQSQSIAPSAAVLGDMALAAWNEGGSDGDGYGIIAQLISNTTSKVGAPFLVNTNTSYDQINPSVIASENEYWVFYSSNDQNVIATDISYQLLNSTSGKKSSEKRANTDINSGTHTHPSAASLLNGAVAVWTTQAFTANISHIDAALFDTNGNRVGNPFAVNNNTAFSQTFASVASSDNGIWAVSYSCYRADGFSDICVRVFNASTPVTNEIRVNSASVGRQDQSSIKALDNGNFIISYEFNDSNNWRARFAILDSQFQLLVSDVPVNAVVNSDERNPRIVPLANSNFLMLLSSGNAIYTLPYNSAGNKTEVNATVISPSNQLSPEHPVGISFDGENAAVFWDMQGYIWADFMNVNVTVSNSSSSTTTGVVPPASTSGTTGSGTSSSSTTGPLLNSSTSSSSHHPTKKKPSADAGQNIPWEIYLAIGGGASIIAVALVLTALIISRRKSKPDTVTAVEMNKTNPAVLDRIVAAQQTPPHLVAAGLNQNGVFAPVDADAQLGGSYANRSLTPAPGDASGNPYGRPVSGYGVPHLPSSGNLGSSYVVVPPPVSQTTQYASPADVTNADYVAGAADNQITPTSGGTGYEAFDPLHNFVGPR